MFLLIVYQYAFVIFYASYYFGELKIGFPFTWEVIYPYLKEIRNPFDAGYISTQRMVVLYLTMIVLTVLLIRLYRNIHKEFQQIPPRSSWIKYRKLGIIFMLGFSIGWLVLPSEKKTSIKNNEPALAFFSATMNDEARLSGIENIEIKKAYPSNLEFDKKNVILIICDALRADYIGAYGGEQGLTPFLDSLVYSGNFIKKDHHFATTSWSYNGISSTMSSSYHLYNNNFYVYDALKKQGYDVRFFLTGDFTNFISLAKQIRTESVDEYMDGYLAREQNPNIQMNDDTAVVLQQLKEMDAYKENPTFLYLHFMTSHEVGVLKEKNIPKLDLMKSKQDPLEMKLDYKRRMKELDANLNEALKTLEKKGYLENAMVIITSDHGQSLGEKEQFFHAHTAYYHEVKIPLLMTNHNGNKGFVDGDMPSNQLDIAPTIADVLGIPIPQNWTGSSLFSNRPANELIFQHQRSYYAAIWTENEKVYQFVHNHNKDQDELFDITNDQDLDKNLLPFYPQKKADSIKRLIFEFYGL